MCSSRYRLIAEKQLFTLAELLFIKVKHPSQLLGLYF